MIQLAAIVALLALVILTIVFWPTPPWQIRIFNSLLKENDMLPTRLSDLEKERPYARYQVEIKQEDGTWAGSVIYACPVERFRLLLGRAGLKENERLRRVHTDHADMAMVTDNIITTIRP